MKLFVKLSKLLVALNGHFSAVAIIEECDKTAIGSVLDRITQHF